MSGSTDTKTFFANCLKDPANSICADCRASQPQWASSNLGVFICISCSGAHRTLGTHISRVKSLFLDSWTDEELKVMRDLGNEKGNSLWEACLPPYYVRPQPEDSTIFKECFIKAKYERKEFFEKGTTEAAIPTKEGYLTKKGEVVKNWKKRWFVLHGTVLCYYKKPPSKVAKPVEKLCLITQQDDAPAGEILLSECSGCDATSDMSVLDKFHNCFEIKTPTRNYYISAESPRMMYEWIQAIRQGMLRLVRAIEVNAVKPEDVKLEELGEVLKKSPPLLRKHQIEKKSYKDCFLGVEFTDWLLTNYKLRSRDDGVQLAQRIFKAGHLLSLSGPAEFVDGRFCYQLKAPKP